jgi:hypothetical protein
MDLGEILDRTFRLYRAHFMTFFLIMLMVHAISFLTMLAVRAVYPQSTFWMIPLAPGQTPNPMAVVGFLLVMVVGFLTSQIGIGMLTVAVSSIYLGQPIQIGHALRRVRPALNKLVGTTLLSFMIIGFGMLACLVPGVYFLLSYLLVGEVIVIEGQGGSKALRRSHELMRTKSEKGFLHNNIMKASVILIVVFALRFMASMIVGIPFGILLVITHRHGQPVDVFAPLLILQQVVTMVLQAGLAPIGIIAMILFYYDIRIRTEGFDLQVLASALGSEAVPLVVP